MSSTVSPSARGSSRSGHCSSCSKTAVPVAAYDCRRTNRQGCCDAGFLLQSLVRTAPGDLCQDRIKAKIRADTQLTASAGVSYNKFLAKLAPDYRKPDGLFVITSEMGPGFVEALTVERFHGIGPATAAKMKELGIFTALDLKTKDEAFLLRYFGKAGPHFYCICRGIDPSAGSTKSGPQVDRSGEHLCARPYGLGRHASRTWSASRQSLALLRHHRDAGTNGDAQGQIRGLPDHHPK